MEKSKKIKSRRNGEIEFLRFVFATMVVLKHSINLIGAENSKYFLKASFAVEFFFIVSGYFMMVSVDKFNSKSKNNFNLGIETVGFIKRKVKSFYLELCLANCIGIIFILATSTESLKRILKLIAVGLHSDFFLLGMLIGGEKLNGPLWYLSSMLLCFTILYPLIRRWPDIMCKVVIPISSFLLIGYLWQTYGSLLTPNFWMGFTFKGNFRAMAEIGIGITMYQVIKNISKLKLNFVIKVFITFIKWFCYLILFVYMIFFNDPTVQIFCLILYILAIGLTFSEKCLDSKIYNNKFCILLGKLSLPMYLCHIYFSSPVPEISSLNNVLPNGMSDGKKIFVYYIVALMTAILISIISRFIRKYEFLSKL